MYTIKRAAELTGIGLPTLRAWERRYGVVSPERSEGRYRLYSDGDLRALAIMASLVEDGWTASEAAAETLRRLDAVDRAARAPGDLDLAAPDGGEPEGLEEVMAAAHDLDGSRLGAVLDRAFDDDDYPRMVGGWLMPVLLAVGSAWADGRITTAGEHLVSHAVHRRLAVLYDATPRTRTGPLIVLGLPAGSRHELGLLAFAVGARRAGMSTAYLGADLPADDWVHAVTRRRAGAAVLAVPRLADVVATQTVVDRIRENAPDVVVAVGGGHQEHVTGGLRLGHDLAAGVESLGRALAGSRAAGSDA
ncbi:cobalamin-dependent protein [Knoellia locipacati]|uniref:MerR family transcriptional regulator n=1 Tax=Knoellia locipacati TaxID=882824 RepID=A0A512SZM5_9MICO|nr:MerR family transcriptional regulator [Knoellia locipacati]GEQ13425.1 MerR family transcriptional regulator [Knoellia locipacati]